MARAPISIAALVGSGVISDTGGGVGPAPWYDPRAIIDYYPATSKYRYNGVEYATKAEWEAAVGAVASGAGEIIGPAVEAGATNLILRGDMSGTTADFAVGQASGGPATLAIASGELQLNGNGSTNAYTTQNPPVERTKSYRVRAKTRRDASSNVGVKLAASGSPNLGSVLSGTSLQNQAALTQRELSFAPAGDLTSVFVGIISQTGALAGFNALDDLDMFESKPFVGFIENGSAGLIEYITDATGVGIQVIEQSDENGTDGGTLLERHRWRFIDDNGVLKFQIYYNTTGTTSVLQKEWNLGAYPRSTPVKLQYALTTNFATVRLNDNPSQTPFNLVNMPPAAVLRIGKGRQTGTDALGTIVRVRVFSSFITPDDVSFNPIIVLGDSYASGIQSRLGAVSNRVIISMGAGGRSHQDRVDYYAAALAADPKLNTYDMVFQDGKPNDYVDVPTYTASVQRLRNLRNGSGRNVYLPPIKTAIGSSEIALIDSLRPGINSIWGSAVCDGQALMAATAVSPGDDAAVAATVAPPSCINQQDQVHPNEKGYAAEIGAGSTPVSGTILAKLAA